MIPRIQSVSPQDGYRLLVTFDGGGRVVYDVAEDIRDIPAFADLVRIPGLFRNVRLDSSRTVVVWNDMIDLPGDTILEHGRPVAGELDAGR